LSYSRPRRIVKVPKNHDENIVSNFIITTSRGAATLTNYF
jgi:hypothetical protein